ncbi:MAG TPA: hypothetical protein VGB70_02440 [Allosphingosinicella sp.]|jgi:hypothetical protein
MLRAILLVVALLIVLAIVALKSGLVDVTQTQQAQAPRLDVKVNDVDVGTQPANVQVPTVGTTTRQIEVPSVSIDKGEATGNAQ